MNDKKTEKKAEVCGKQACSLVRGRERASRTRAELLKITQELGGGYKLLSCP